MLSHLARVFRPYGNCVAYLSQRLIGRGTGINALYFPNLLIHPIIYINPQKVERVISLSIKPNRGNCYFMDGDWSNYLETIAERQARDPKYQTTSEIILQRMPINKTAETEWVQEKIRERGSYRGYTSAVEYMKKIEGLYLSLQKFGYRRSLQEKLFPWSGGIECVIGKDLELIKINAGNHRFYGAYVLGLSSIPVKVCAIDASYMREGASPLNTVRNIQSSVQKKYA